MRTPLKRWQRRIVRHCLDANAGVIRRSLHHTPDDVDGREMLWERRCRLLRRMDELA